MLKIIKAPSPVLANKTHKIKKNDSAVREYITQMKQTLESAKDPEGVGLAAPQVGISLQLFITKPTDTASVSVFINPAIERFIQSKIQDSTVRKKVKKKDTKLEGCLSVDDIWGIVRRSHGVVLSYLDESGKSHKRTFTGFMSTIIQHEVDHLNGILFTKRVIEQKEKLYKSTKNAAGETVFDEIKL